MAEGQRVFWARPSLLFAAHEKKRAGKKNLFLCLQELLTSVKSDSIFSLPKPFTEIRLIFPPFRSPDAKLSLIFFSAGVSHCLWQAFAKQELAMGTN